MHRCDNCQCLSHHICPPAGPSVLLISVSIPRGWGLSGDEPTGVDSVSVEHLENIWDPTRRSVAPIWQQPLEPSPCSRAAAQSVPLAAQPQPVLPTTISPGFSKSQDRLGLSPSQALAALHGDSTRSRGPIGSCCGCGAELCHTPVTKGDTHGSPILIWFMVPNGEEQNGTPKPGGTEPSWSPSLATSSWGLCWGKIKGQEGSPHVWGEADVGFWPKDLGHSLCQGPLPGPVSFRGLQGLSPCSVSAGASS